MYKFVDCWQSTSEFQRGMRCRIERKEMLNEERKENVHKEMRVE